MANKVLRRISVVLAVIMLASASCVPVCAAWEEGISVSTATSVNSKSKDSADFEKAYTDTVLQHVNAERNNRELSSLCELDTINKIADIRASESAVSFLHIRPDGRSCSTVYSDSNLTYSYAGENLAFGYNDPAALVNAWMNSQSHRKNILNGAYQYVGVGFFVNANGTIYCSMLFYTPEQ